MTRKLGYSEVPYSVKEISFEVGRFRVVGDLLLPSGDMQHPLAIFVWGSGKAGRHLVERPSKIITTFIQAGYAVFIEDKPGWGASTGEFSQEHLLRERAEILEQEIEELKIRPEINSHQVGVYGTSQAGYVMSLAARSGTKFDFMIAVSCPAEDSVTQSAYLVRQQLLCEGYSIEVARKAEFFYVQRERAEDYQTYVEAANFLDVFPIIRDDLGWGGIMPKERFSPLEEDSERSYNPTGEYEKMTIPVLAIFGAKDTQIDPVQGRGAFQNSLKKNGNSLSRVVMLADTDHGMYKTITGCIKEQIENRKKRAFPGYNPEFIKILGAWLNLLNL